MAWEMRAGKRVYIRKVRQGKHVRSEFIGGGQVGELAAKADQTAREQKRLIRQQYEDPEELADLDTAIDAVEREAQAQAVVTLTALGYHKRKGQWQRKRQRRN